MSNNVYTPDKWCIVRKINDPDYYYVFGSWPDHWRINSGIVETREEENAYVFVGHSGSEFHCHKEAYGTTVFGAATLCSYGDVLTMIEEDDFNSIRW